MFNPEPIFRDRREAGKVLAQYLKALVTDSGPADLAPIVLALPRGGVPVGFEVAQALHAPLDVFIVRKLGVPGQEELAMGAVASGGIRVLNEELIAQAEIPPQAVEREAARALQEIERREHLYREGRPPPPLGQRTVILVDDGLATGATMLAAVRAVRLQHPLRIIVAVPVAARQSCELLQQSVDQVVCAATPEPFQAVGLWYDNFEQTSDQEVRELLQQASREKSHVKELLK